MTDYLDLVMSMERYGYRVFVDCEGNYYWELQDRYSKDFATERDAWLDAKRDYYEFV